MGRAYGALTVLRYEITPLLSAVALFAVMNILDASALLGPQPSLWNLAANADLSRWASSSTWGRRPAPIELEDLIGPDGLPLDPTVVFEPRSPSSAWHAPLGQHGAAGLLLEDLPDNTDAVEIDDGPTCWPARHWSVSSVGSSNQSEHLFTSSAPGSDPRPPLANCLPSLCAPPSARIPRAGSITVSARTPWPAMIGPPQQPHRSARPSAGWGSGPSAGGSLRPRHGGGVPAGAWSAG